MDDEALPGASFAALLDVVEDMAGATGGATTRLGAAVGALMRAVGATSGVLLHGGPAGLDVRAVAPPARAGGDLRVRVLDGEQPLLDPVLAGGTRVTTAARAYGQEAWAASARRRAVLADLGVDQLVALPVRGGPDRIVVLLGRRGADFTDAHLALLAALLPAVEALTSLLEPHLRCARDGVVHRLTERESTVLALLAQGHTAVRIAHLAGCSPRTVHHHLASIYAKLGARDRLSAVTRARELGLVAAADHLAEPAAPGAGG